MAFIGTAGWSIPALHAQAFAGTGTHLERYGAVLNAVEINSSFYRPHRQKTYARWAASVPEDFRFSVKLPRAITHHQRLTGFEADLARFQDEVSGLGRKLGVIRRPPLPCSRRWNSQNSRPSPVSRVIPAGLHPRSMRR